MAIAVTALALIALATFAVYHRASRRTPNWQERGEPRGRTKAEPEGTLHIKVTRADGTVEDHGTVPAHRSK